MLSRVLTGVIAALAAAFAAMAQDDAVMAHYAAYNEAVAAGDVAAADTHGEAAWRAAEESWGGTQQTGMLALNLATLRLDAGMPAEAFEPAGRVLELAEAGVMAGAAETLDVALIVGLAQAASGDEEGALTRLSATLTARDQAGLPETDFSAIARLRAASIAVDREEYSAAAQFARRAREAALLIGGDFGVEAALVEDRALSELGDLAGSLQAVRFAEASFAGEITPANIQLRSTLMRRRVALQQALETGRPPLSSGQPCAPPTRGALPHFPRRALDRRRSGIVVVAFDVAPDGNGENVRVLAESPEGFGFGAAAVELITGSIWNVSGITRPECMNGQIAARYFEFPG